MTILETSVKCGLNLFTNIGDTHVRLHPTIGFAVPNSAAVMRLGTDDGGVSPEYVILLRYNLSDCSPALPSSAYITRAYFQYEFAGTPTVDATFGFVRVGHLERDGAWDGADDRGWAVDGYYPNSTFFPRATDPGTDVINSGVLVDDAFMGGFFYLASASAGDIRGVGDAGYSPNFDLTFDPNEPRPLAATLERDRARYGSHPLVAFVFDPDRLPASADEFCEFAAAEGLGEDGILLKIEYDTDPHRGVRAFESRARPAVAHGEVRARPAVTLPAEPRARSSVRAGEHGARPTVRRGKVRARPTVRHFPAGPRST